MAATRSPRLPREAGPLEAFLWVAARSRNRAALDGPSALLRGFATSRPGGDTECCHPRPVFFSSATVLYGHDPATRDSCDRAPATAAAQSLRSSALGRCSRFCAKPYFRVDEFTARSVVSQTSDFSAPDPGKERGAKEMLYSRTRCTTSRVRPAVGRPYSAAPNPQCLPRALTDKSRAPSRTRDPRCCLFGRGFPLPLPPGPSTR